MDWLYSRYLYSNSFTLLARSLGIAGLIAGLFILAIAPVQSEGPLINDLTINSLQAAPSGAGQATVSAYVSVVDKEGQPILGLGQENFAILEDGVPVEIESVAPATDTMALVLAIDTSGTMASQGSDGRLAIEAAQQAAVSFISTLSDEDKVAVYSFADEVTLRQELTGDHNAAINAVNNLAYKDFGHTCLYDASFQAVKKSVEVRQGRRAVIVLTDGVDETGEGPCSVYTFSDVVEAATELTIKTPIFTVGFGQKINEQELLRMASLTGGRGLIAPDSTQLTALFMSIAGQLKNQYLVTYQSQAVSGEHAVVIKVKANGASGDDERRVFIPAIELHDGSNAPTAGELPTQPTSEPTSEPTQEVAKKVSIHIIKPAPGDPIAGQMEIVVDLSEMSDVAGTSLYVDNQLTQKAVSPPFDRFTLDVTALGPGQHIIRVEAVAYSGAMAFEQRELSVEAQLPPPLTSTLSLTPTSPEENLPPAPSTESRFSLVTLILIAVLLMALLLAVIILLLTRIRRKERKGVISGSDGGTGVSDDIYQTQSVDNEETILPDAGIKFPSRAQLVILEGPVNDSSSSFISITDSKLTMGRNAKGITNTVDIKDPKVSRRHAEILFDGREFSIQDLNSGSGTRVNGVRIEKFSNVLLRNGDILHIGPDAKFRFELNPVLPGSPYEDFYPATKGQP